MFYTISIQSTPEGPREQIVCMIIIIDAYNVLKQASSAQLISDAQRIAFIKQLARYAHIKGHTIMVVFDAGESSRPTEEKRGALRIIYSGHNTNADEIIKKLCAQCKHLQTVVVSNDREICSFASFHGIACIEALGLYELLQSTEQIEEIKFQKQSGQALKRAGHQSSAELDALMQESTQHMLLKSEDVQFKSNNRQSVSATPSKAEKKIKKLVNKL